jgi:hypothetical protein
VAYKRASSPVLTGAALGVVAFFLWQFRIIKIAVLLGILYVCCLFLYDVWFTQEELPPSAYSMRIAFEDAPDLAFTRKNPQWTVDVQMTNKGEHKIRRWTLHGKLYDCPRAFAPIDMCRFVTEQSQWVDTVVRPGEMQESTEIVDFWNANDTTGQLRVVWSVGTAISDSDTQDDKLQDSWKAARQEAVD